MNFHAKKARLFMKEGHNERNDIMADIFMTICMTLLIAAAALYRLLALASAYHDAGDEARKDPAR